MKIFACSHWYLDIIHLTWSSILVYSKNSEDSLPSRPSRWCRLLPARLLHGLPPMTRSNPPNELINCSKRFASSSCTSAISTKFPLWLVCSHQLLTIFLFASEISTATTFLRGIPSRCRATSAPPMPEKSESTLMPLGNKFFKTDRWYATVSTWNKLNLVSK